jgi:hypothetical protein
LFAWWAIWWYFWYPIVQKKQLKLNAFPTHI